MPLNMDYGIIMIGGTMQSYKEVPEEQGFGKKIILDFLDFIKYKVESDSLTMEEADSVGVDLESETPAYIAGDSARELSDIICSLGCDH